MRWGDAAAGEGPEVRLHPAVGGKGEGEGREGKEKGKAGISSVVLVCIVQTGYLPPLWN